MGFLLGLLGQDVGKLLMWGFFGEIIDKMWELFGENVDFCPDIPHICSCPAHSIEHPSAHTQTTRWRINGEYMGNMWGIIKPSGATAAR